MILATPLAAAGFATAAVLTAVYCFRRKSPPRTVGSLLLWPKPTVSLSAARRRDRLRTPPSFWLELFILLALVCAALTPLTWRQSSGSLTVILDTSPSMSAGDAGKKAAEFLEREKKRGAKDAIRVRKAKDVRALERELASARAIQLPGDEILVLTDRPPEIELPSAGIRWEAFGAPSPNCAITAARRRRRDPAHDSVFVEVRRFGDGPDSCTLEIEGAGKSTLKFDSEGRALFSGTVASSLPSIKASIPHDALDADNTIHLAPPDVPSISAALDFSGEELSALVRRALDATGFVREYAAPGEAADLVATDRAGGSPGRLAPPAYRLVFLASGTNYVRGPVWTEPSERLLEGVSLDGVPYALSDSTPEGVPVAMVAGRAIIAVGTNVCTVAFSNPRLEFFRSPAFPALVQNAAAAAAEAARAARGSDTPKKSDEAQADVLDADESDLSRCGTGSFGAPAAPPENALRTSSAAWIPALAAIAALLLHFYLYRRKAALVAAALAVLAMARPVFPRSERCGTLVVAADRSLSMGDDALKEQEKIIRSLASKRPAAADLAVVSFGRGSAVEQQPSKTGFEGFIQTIGRDGSDLPGALAKAEALAQPGAPARVLVLSDGLTDNDGEAACALPVDSLLQTRPFAHDLAVSRIDASPSVTPGGFVCATAWIYSPEASTNSYVLACGTNVVAHGARVFREGLTPLVFRDRAEKPGIRRYTLTVSPSSDDPCPENNRATFVVETRGGKPLLWLHEGAESPAAAVARAAGVNVDSRSAADFECSVETLAGYGGVVLENMPAKHFQPAAMRSLTAFVEEMGRGLAMTGGDKAFGPGGWYRTAVEDILPVSLELRQEHRKYSIAMAIVMDRSGSMACAAGSGGRTKMDMANLGAANAIDMLGPMDQVAVIAVDSAPHMVLGLQYAPEAKANRGRVLSIQSMGGGIFVKEGIMAGMRELAKAEAAVKHIILFADAADAEEPGDYENYLSKALASGITVSVIALGTERDSDAQLLKRIAEAGQGGCYFEDNAAEIPRIFQQDTYLNCKLAMVTNPAPVKVGAALRQLSDAVPPAKLVVGGYNVTYRREECDTAMLALPENDDPAPLLAFRRAGLGRTLAFTGELSGPHSAPLMTSEYGAELTAAIARWTLGEEGASASGFYFERRAVAGGMRITAVAESDNPLAALSNAGLPIVTIVQREGSGPEKVHGALKWDDAETLSAFVPLSGGETAFPVVMLPSGKPLALPPICLPYPGEYRRATDPRAGQRNLARLSEATGGRSLATADTAWDALPPFRHAIQLAPAIYLIAALVILAAVAAARLGWRIAVKMPPLPKISRRPKAPKTSRGQEKTVAPDKPENQGKQEKPAKTDNPEESGTAAAFAAVRRRVRR